MQSLHLFPSQRLVLMTYSSTKLVFGREESQAMLEVPIPTVKCQVQRKKHQENNSSVYNKIIDVIFIIVQEVIFISSTSIVHSALQIIGLIYDHPGRGKSTKLGAHSGRCLHCRMEWKDLCVSYFYNTTFIVLPGDNYNSYLVIYKRYI